MTVPGATAPQPGRALHTARPAGRLWALVLVGLLALLPCAGRAQAVTAAPQPQKAATAYGPQAVTPDRSAAPAAAHHQLKGGPLADALADAGLPLTWCTADGDHPRPGDGCSDHPFCGSESQLPNAPPHPAAIAPAQLVLETALPRPVPCTPLIGTDLAPDLHALQVHRT
ncbi:hypothetical protein [Kitasatospora sp. McL0602]|uniref:hypothetical protein n=1 Tax=Kitasatospora sp. McL0602 TaxID=3439530 RepID=UPI003F89883B